MLEGGVNHEWFGHCQEKRGFRQEEGDHREGRLLLACQLKLVLRRRMRLMLIMIMVVIALVIIVVIRRMCDGS
jgi:hypothetical protein